MSCGPIWLARSAASLSIFLALGLSAVAKPTPTPAGEPPPAPTPFPAATAIATTPTPLPVSLPVERVRPGPEHRRLRYLVGEWQVAVSRFLGNPLNPPAAGTLSVRFDMGGLLLIERWSFTGYEARVLWAWDAAARAFRVYRFDSAGAIGQAYDMTLAPGAVILERKVKEGDTTRVERMTYTAPPPPPAEPGPQEKEKKEPKPQPFDLVILKAEAGPEGGTLAPVFEATLVRSSER